MRIKKRTLVLLMNGFGRIGFGLEGMSLCFLLLKDGIVSEHSVSLHLVWSLRISRGQKAVHDFALFFFFLSI